MRQVNFFFEETERTLAVHFVQDDSDPPLTDFDGTQRFAVHALSTLMHQYTAFTKSPTLRVGD